ncbi:Cof-type HAD-IIB family hydrolase [Fundicoccus ignavus]|uniref:Cof-type HAD-IIB family hydrolase n=1 Tax=Fundicoccus ignavus TaxID=2664442 RepID=A0A844CJK3_9LACT|nr:Cof-type HAD-IIB family hydrolase [Fundicoccus ignavus]MRJ47915.1 Cof-type HAD-IIB family hydrolase [Fundicoccus ignavus]
MIKLFASDMDGTLLNENHVISDRTAAAIKKLQETTDIEFIIATGRSFKSASVLTQAQDIYCRMINLNGASIHEKDGTLTDSNPLLTDTVLSVIQYLDTLAIDYAVSTPNNYYVADYEGFIKRIAHFMNVSHEEVLAAADGTDEVTNAQLLAHYGDVKPITEMELTKENPALKLLLFSSNADLLSQVRQHLSNFSDLDVTSSAADNIEVTHINAQKGLAVEAYAKSQGYTLDEVATIGDSLNDRSMLQMAKHSYAMDNAPDHIKAMAQNIAPANTIDGVAIILEQLIAEYAK